MNPSIKVQEKWIKNDTFGDLIKEMYKHDNYLKSTGRTYKDYAAAFSNWLVSDYRKKNQKPRNPYLDEA